MTSDVFLTRTINPKTINNKKRLLTEDLAKHETEKRKKWSGGYYRHQSAVGTTDIDIQKDIVLTPYVRILNWTVNTFVNGLYKKTKPLTTT